MFVLNGNRRPHSAFSVVIDDEVITGSQYMYKKQVISGFVYDVVRALSKMETFTDRQVKEHFKGMGKIEWKTVQTEFVSREVDFLYNIEYKKTKERRYFLTVYILPSDIFKKKPVQQENGFVAELKSTATIEDTRLTESPVVGKYVYQVTNTKETFVVKSKPEAEFYVEKNGGEFKKINVIEADGKFFEIGQELASKKVDTFANKLQTFKDQTKQTFQVKVEGIRNKISFSHNVDNLKPGLYSLFGHYSGFLFVEVIRSAVSGDERKVHYIKEKTPTATRLLEKYDLIKTV